MIGAMPAVAVRHERRRQEKRTKRPSLLFLHSPSSRSPTPSPMQSPPAKCSRPDHEIYICAKVSVLHVVVVTLLAGSILLIVGLVQLKPGAEASQHKFLLIGSGGSCILFGTMLAIIRCCLMPWVIRRRQTRLDYEPHRKRNGEPKLSHRSLEVLPTTDSINTVAKQPNRPRTPSSSSMDAKINLCTTKDICKNQDRSSPLTNYEPQAQAQA